VVGAFGQPQQTRTAAASSSCQVDEIPATLAGGGTPIFRFIDLTDRPPPQPGRGMPKPPTTKPQPTGSKPPTDRQLRYLKALATRTGQTFTSSATSAQASREINRLTNTSGNGFTFAEHQPAATTEGRLNGAGCRDDEITGYGSNCRWNRS
jgi:Protein of unknown function (DUF3072)